MTPSRPRIPRSCCGSPPRRRARASRSRSARSKALAESAPELRAPWPPDALNALVELLGAGEGLVDAVESLDRTGLWARLFPEWGAVRDLPPRSPVHQWTVDRHLIRTCVEAAKLTTTVPRPDLLLIGALLHDIGKGRDADHSELGAKISAQVAMRLGLSPADAATVSAMVRHHLLLPHTATRRDISEPATVSRVVKTLDSDIVLVELLHALTQADSLATGPGVWTDWKARLLAQLVTGCEEVLRGKGFTAPEPMDDEQRELVKQAVASGNGEVRISSQGKVVTVLLAVPARAELLAPAAGVLALNSMEVHSAVLRGHDGGRAGVFTASPKFGSLPDATLLREQFARAVAGTLPLTQRLAAKERDYGSPAPVAPKVLWFDDETSGPDTVVLELRAADRIGLLFRVAGALRRCDAEVRWAKVSTLGGAVVDSFAVTPRSGRIEPGWRREVEQAILAAASWAMPEPGRTPLPLTFRRPHRQRASRARRTTCQRVVQARATRPHDVAVGADQLRRRAGAALDAVGPPAGTAAPTSTPRPSGATRDALGAAEHPRVGRCRCRRAPRRGAPGVRGWRAARDDLADGPRVRVGHAQHRLRTRADQHPRGDRMAFVVVAVEQAVGGVPADLSPRASTPGSPRPAGPG